MCSLSASKRPSAYASARSGAPPANSSSAGSTACPVCSRSHCDRRSRDGRAIVDLLAAAAHRRQQQRRPRREQHQQTLAATALRASSARCSPRSASSDAPARRWRPCSPPIARLRQTLGGRAHLIDRDLLLVLFRRDPSRSGCEPALISAQLAHSPQQLQRRAATCSHSTAQASHAANDCFAQAFRTLQQQRVGETVRCPCLAQLCGGSLMPRQQPLRQETVRRSLSWAHESARIIATSMAADRVLDARRGRRVASMTANRPGSAARAFEVAAAHALEEFALLLLEAIARRRSAHCAPPRAPCRSRSAHRAATSDPGAARACTKRSRHAICSRRTPRPPPW